MPKTPKHFIAYNNGYWYECWYEPNAGGRKLIKKPIHDGKNEPIKGKKNRDRASDVFRNGKKIPGNNQKATFEEFIPDFTQYLKDRKLKDSSIRLYLRDVRTFMPKLPLYMQEVTLQEIEQALGTLEGQCPDSKSRFATSLGRFFSVAKRKGRVDKNPLAEYEKAKSKTVVNPYTEEQIFKLIEVAKELDKQFPDAKGRYTALIIFALQNGLRMQEYINLRWKWFDIKNRTYNICIDEKFRPKHDHERIIHILKLSFNLINKLPRDSDYIFPNTVGNRDWHLESKFLKNIFTGANLITEEDNDFHQIRKTCASYRLACGEAMQNLKAHLGHQSLRELEAYVGKVVNPSQEIRKLFDVNTK